jgi:hypothetical protein
METVGGGHDRAAFLRHQRAPLLARAIMPAARRRWCGPYVGAMWFAKLAA